MNTSFKFLITGARSPVALHIARNLESHGHTVFLADSVPFSLGSFSKKREAFFLLSSPRFHYAQFVEQLIFFVQKYDIDCIIPTCEEVFYISKALPQLQTYCDVFTDDIIKMKLVHNKFEFMDYLKDFDSIVQPPKSFLVHSSEEVQYYISKYADLSKFVLKPVYSRFGSKVHIFEREEMIPDIVISKEEPYVLQEFIQGTQFCTYSICCEGETKAYSGYVSKYVVGKGATIYFENCVQKEIQHFVEKLVKHLQFHGQIAFDFIVSKDKIYIIECNPRTTSGVHLFEPEQDLSLAIRGTVQEGLKATTQSFMLSLPMLSKFNSQPFKKWNYDFSRAKDVLWNKEDMLPFFGQFILYGYFLFQAIKLNTNILSVTTRDIEWSDE